MKTTSTSDRKNCFIDIETYSNEDISKCGVYRYAADPSLEVLLFSYAIDNGPVVCLDFTDEGKRAEHIKTVTGLLDNLELVKIAHNANFEMVVLEALGYPIHRAQWECTMAMANHAGLPASLESLSSVLGLGDKGKLAIGKKLVKEFCTPQKKAPKRVFPGDDPEGWKTFMEYNIRDVEAERAIFYRLKGSYQECDKPVWLVDQAINSRGVRIDLDLAKAAIAMSNEVTERDSSKLFEITGLENPNSTPQLKDWLAKQGVTVESLTKTVCEDLIKTTPLQHVKKALELKMSISKASVKKYDAMIRAVCPDGRLRGAFQYYGANRTGRWAGRLVQLQNLRRNSLPDLDEVRECVKAGNEDAIRLGWPDMDVSEVLGQLVRTAFIPSEGNKFIVCDYSAIEARVIAWLAGEKWRQEVFAHDGDIYKSSYSTAFGVPVSEVTKPMRQKGKIMELALGYGGGPGALKAFGADKLGLNDEELKDLVVKWRNASPKIVKFWRDVEQAARTCVQDGSIVRISQRGIIFKCHIGGHMSIKIPSGRRLFYRDMDLRDGRFGNELCYKGVNQVSRQWDVTGTHGGKLVENITQAVARDCLAHAMLSLESSGHAIVSHIHDEVIIDSPTDVPVSAIEEIMGTPIQWAPGLHLTAKGYQGNYYFKD